MNKPNLIVVAESAHDDGLAQQVAERLQLPYAEGFSPVTDDEDMLWLRVGASGIGLGAAGIGLNPFYVDFVTGAMGYRKRKLSLKNELIGKAVAIKSKFDLRVVDATAGFGRDAFILAQLGCPVCMLERNPVVALLLEDGIKRAARDNVCNEVIERMELISVDAASFLTAINQAEQPDVVYLDPMFPERRKAAKVKKEMQLLQGLLGSHDGQPGLLSLARTRAGKKVVVKRPAKAPCLENQSPDYSVKGKSSRFDIYLTC